MYCELETCKLKKELERKSNNYWKQKRMKSYLLEYMRHSKNSVKMEIYSNAIIKMQYMVQKISNK